MSDLKAQANANFAQGKYKEADELYAACLLNLFFENSPPPFSAQVLADFAILHGNRSICLLKEGLFNAAFEEAELAVLKNPTWSKAHFRKAEALKALCKWKEAATCFQEAQRCSGDPDSFKTQIRFCLVHAKQEEVKPSLQRLKEHCEKQKSIEFCPVQPSFSQFEVDSDILGEGNYSQVLKTKFKLTGEVFAMKVIDRKKAERMSMRHGNLNAELRAERRILSRIRHVNMIKLFLAFQDSSNIYYLQELVDGRELFYQLKIKPPHPKLTWESKKWSLCGLRSSLAKFYLAQLVNALEYLQSQAIVHRDLKPENIMICQNNGLLKLIDFGTARDLLDVEDDFIADADRRAEGEGPREISKGRPRTHFVGTSEFMSPETVHGRPADFRSDLWSFGCTAFQLFTGRTPFKGGSDYLTFLKAEAASYTMPSHLQGSQEEALIGRLLRVDANERIQTAKLVKQDAYFASVDFDSLLNVDSLFIPPPTLLEERVEQLGNAIWIQAEELNEGPCTALKRAHSKNPLPTKLGLDAEALGLSHLHETLDPECLMQLRGWCEQRSILSCPSVLRVLHGGGSRPTMRIYNHSLLGWSQQEEGVFTEPYVFGVVDSMRDDGDVQLQDDMLLKFGESSPRPRILLVPSQVQLNTNLPLAPVSTPENLADYYSFWVSGVLFIVLDAPRFNETQAEWFSRELLVGKLCARYVLVVSSRKWMSTKSSVFDSPHKAATFEEDKEEDVFDLANRLRFLPEMQRSHCHLILLVDQRTSSRTMVKRGKTAESASPIVQVGTVGFPDRLRVVRCLPVEVVSDAYAKEELSGYFHLPEFAKEAMEGEDEARVYSDSSDAE